MTTTNTTNALYRHLYECDEQIQVLQAESDLAKNTREYDFLVEKISMIQEIEITPTVDELELRGEILETYFTV